MRLEDRKFLRFKWEDKLYQYTCLPNGLAQAPRNFTKILKPIFGHLAEQGHTTFGYIDDTFIMGDSREDCEVAIEALRDCFVKLGFQIRVEKSVLEPVRELTFLGYVLNSVTMKVYPTGEKISKGLELLREFRARKRSTIRQLAGLIGVLNDLTKGCEYGTGHYRHLEKDKTRALARSKGDFEGYLELSPNAKNDLTWWMLNLARAQRRIWLDIPEICLTMDACDYGWGAVFECPTRGKLTTNGRWSAKEKEGHINIKETRAIWLGLLTFAKDLRNCQIKCRIDNTTAVAYLNHQGGMKNAECDQISRDIWGFAQERNLWLRAVHIPGVDNVEADHESRVKENLEWELPQNVFENLQRDFGPFEIDLFASRTAHKLKRYVFWLPDPFAEDVDALSISWKHSKFYAFPPFSLIPKVIRKAKREAAKGIIITPRWKAQPWYAILMKMTKEKRLGKIELLNPIDGSRWSLELAAWQT